MLGLTFYIKAYYGHTIMIMYILASPQNDNGSTVGVVVMG